MVSLGQHLNAAAKRSQLSREARHPATMPREEKAPYRDAILEGYLERHIERHIEAHLEDSELLSSLPSAFSGA